MCFVWISGQMIISINALTDWFFITETYSTHCVIWAESLNIQGGSNMTRTDLCVNKPHCAAAVRP